MIISINWTHTLTKKCYYISLVSVFSSLPILYLLHLLQTLESPAVPSKSAISPASSTTFYWIISISIQACSSIFHLKKTDQQKLYLDSQTPCHLLLLYLFPLIARLPETQYPVSVSSPIANSTFWQLIKSSLIIFSCPVYSFSKTPLKVSLMV